MFQARRRRESGKGNTNMHEDKLAKAKKRPYRCLNELDESDDEDDDDDDQEQQERSFVNQTSTSDSIKNPTDTHGNHVKVEEV